MLIRSFRCAAVAALFSICGVALAQEPVGGGETPPQATGQDAGSRMRAALDAVAELTGVKGEERRERLLACATTFDGIADAFANDLDVVARAAWEAGECRRRAGKLESANASYERCLATGSKRYLERASFEHGSMLRRLAAFSAPRSGAMLRRLTAVMTWGADMPLTGALGSSACTPSML